MSRSSPGSPPRPGRPGAGGGLGDGRGERCGGRHPHASSPPRIPSTAPVPLAKRYGRATESRWGRIMIRISPAGPAPEPEGRARRCSAAAARRSALTATGTSHPAAASPVPGRGESRPWNGDGRRGPGSSGAVSPMDDTNRPPEDYCCGGGALSLKYVIPSIGTPSFSYRPNAQTSSSSSTACQTRSPKNRAASSLFS